MTDCLEEWQALYVAHRATYLGDHNIHVITTHPLDHGFDLIGDVRNHLNSLAKELAFPLFLNDRQVDLSGCVVAVSGESTRCEPLVVPQVQVGLTAVVQHVNFAVLVRTHGPGIDIDIRIQLLHPHSEATLFQQHPDRCARQAFAKGTDHAAGYKNMFRHGMGSYHDSMISEASARHSF